MRIYIITEESDSKLYTSREVFNILWKLICDLESDFETNQYAFYSSKMGIIKSNKHRALMINSIQVIEKMLVDSRKGVLLLQRGQTNEYLVKTLYDLKKISVDFKEELVKLLAGCRNISVKNIVQPIITSLNRFSVIDTGLLSNLSDLSKNIIQGQIMDITEPGSDEAIVYRFNESKTEGILTIKSFKPLIITGRKALIYYFLYKHRADSEDYDYHDVNLYISKYPRFTRVSSDQLRRDVDWLNDQVQGIINNSRFEIIIKKSENLNNKAKRNRYKFVESW
ncbi:hypothetical protein C0583_04595 [Candidatus Parcubacteria bacterium]|nr:MAG: hypothetical protein C0583_04595 [Candidatus Parcubacteria bacterium]